ncbi:hypothetical protein [Nonomuraea sp. B19D2]|uniref:hypothetical protein n=1 Tax=Nonomuraea sp. B19D2 TaxID=3159561 RepID=UPI0032DA520E
MQARREGAELGVVLSRDCVIAVRPDGTASFLFTDFDRILLDSVEYGCTPNLYLHPVTTH